MKFLCNAGEFMAGYHGCKSSMTSKQYKTLPNIRPSPVVLSVAHWISNQEIIISNPQRA